MGGRSSAETRSVEASFLRFGEGQVVGRKGLVPLESLDRLHKGRAKGAEFEQVGTSRGSESCGYLSEGIGEGASLFPKPCEYG